MAKQSNKLFKVLFILGFLSSIIFTDYIYKNQYKAFKQSIKDKNYSYIYNRLDSHFKFLKCRPSKLNQIPFDSVVIIGNAYGSFRDSFRRGHKGLPAKLEDFLELNKEKIGTLIFNGDVFIHPSIDKWNNLYDKYNKEFEIIISPGDLDIGGIYDSTQRDIFRTIIYKKQISKFPILLQKQGFNILIDNSNANDNFIEKSIDMLNNAKINNNIIILRHHVPIKHLRNYKNINREDYVWSPFKIHLKYNLKYLESSFKSFSNLNFIYGDNNGLSCFSHNNISHFASGLGGKHTILVLSKSKIYSYTFN